MPPLPRARLLATAALLTAATAATAACSAGTPAASPPPVTASNASAPASAPGTSAAPGARQLHLVVSGSSVTGDTGTVDVRLGQPVRLTVTSDVADEVHVHGADVHADVAAGGTVVLDFVQSAPGRFEVELESQKRTLTRLQVS